MTVPLTEVESHFLRDRLNHRVRFGHPTRETYIDRRRARAWFEPKSIFGYVRWENGAFGSVLWRLYVLRAGAPGDALCRVPGVRPGAEILLRLDGGPKVKPALLIIDNLEDRGFDPAEVSPDYWRHINGRLAASGTVRPYSAEQHAAWRERREIAL
jgi:hypothetical protein